MAQSEDTDGRRATVDFARIKTEFKKDKARAKSNFTRSRNKLLLLSKVAKSTGSSRGLQENGFLHGNSNGCVVEFL